MVLASPVYFYSIDAQLKAVIDRSVCRWTEVKNKEMYYIMTAADGEKNLWTPHWHALEDMLTVWREQ